MEPFFRVKVEASLEKIEQVNDLVKQKLGQKITKSFKCPKCEAEASRKCDLKVHLKSCHTKPGIDSPKRRKAIKYQNLNGSVLNDLKTNYMNDDVKNTTDDVDRPTHYPSQVEVEDLFSCYTCDFDTDNKDELTNHVGLIHNQDIKEVDGEVDIHKQVKINALENGDKMKECIIICGECGKGFGSQQEFNVHAPTHHVDENNVRITSTEELRVIVETPNTNPVPPNSHCEVCPFCEGQSKDRKELKNTYKIYIYGEKGTE